MLHYVIKRICSVLAAFSMLAFSSVTSVRAEGTITQAQPMLPTSPLTITTQNGAKHNFIVELAKTEKQQETGEMFRQSIAANHGMLFLWDHPQRSDMWMKNTLVSLDILFIDSQHRIHALKERTIPFSEAVIKSHGVVSSVLELPAGTTERLNIVVGDLVESPAFQNENTAKP
ncbi:DUF192 domain-containing protein [Aristophania vespae]|uniref:DUF192 domain-containing protein n=1 Tax=Aristophania vespae TaxID=2697033 RepID=UPI00235159C7|nr:DUF192 domain-containing protein [Aristophania vespae]UMM64120.1 hypothetical protein DM15PD_11050 [Aristophania vespae]